MSFFKKLFLTIPAGIASVFTLQGEAPSPFKAPPAVFAVEDHYQILVTMRSSSLVRIRVGEHFYSGHINGVRPTSRSVHRFIIPMTELNKAGRYTVYYRPLPVRLPYMRHVKRHEEYSRSYDFRKLPDENIRIFHIADTHSRIDQPVQNALSSGAFDLLILNGDLVDTSGKAETLETPAILAGKITGGTLPVIYARGNHELRGSFAEELPRYVPNNNGKLYYTVKLGSLWCMVLDGGEDKTDLHPAYGDTIDCTAYRQEQLAFIRERAVNKDHKNPSVKYRLLICHIPFPRYVGKSAADEEKRLFTIYGEWGKSLKILYAPQLLLSGHVHRFAIEKNQEFPCPVVMGAMLDKKADLASGSRITLNQGTGLIEFLDHNGKTASRERVAF